MNFTDYGDMFSGCMSAQGATGADIAAIEAWANVHLPEAYVALLKRTDGLEGFVAEDVYLVLWPANQVAELNEAYSVAEFAPGLILIGSDGGDTGFAFDTRCSKISIKKVPLVGMSLTMAEEVGTNFENFLERLVSHA